MKNMFRFKRTFKKVYRSTKIYVALKQAKRKVRVVAGMEVSRAASLGLKFTKRQIRIRPRIRLIPKILVILIMVFGLSQAADSYIRARKAEIKINGQAVLVADEHKKSDDFELEINQAIVSKRSPFELQKPVEGYISQGYRNYHQAYDIATDLGTSIRPIGAGIVTFAGKVTDGKGNMVIVDHGDGLKSAYAHMGRIDVGAGNMVDTNSTLGTVGMTGRTTGPHVHLEIYDNERLINPANVLPED